MGISQSRNISQNMIQVFYRVDIEMTDKAVIARNLVAGNALSQVLKQFFNVLKFLLVGPHPNQRLQHIPQRQSAQLHTEAANHTRQFQASQAFAARRSG